MNSIACKVVLLASILIASVQAQTLSKEVTNQIGVWEASGASPGKPGDIVEIYRGDSRLGEATISSVSIGRFVVNFRGVFSARQGDGVRFLRVAAKPIEERQLRNDDYGPGSEVRRHVESLCEAFTRAIVAGNESLALKYCDFEVRGESSVKVPAGIRVRQLITLAKHRTLRVKSLRFEEFSTIGLKQYTVEYQLDEEPDRICLFSLKQFGDNWKIWLIRTE